MSVYPLKTGGSASQEWGVSLPGMRGQDAQEYTTKHVSIFYRVDNDQIVLLDFFDNRSDPKKKDAL